MKPASNQALLKLVSAFALLGLGGVAIGNTLGNTFGSAQGGSSVSVAAKAVTSTQVSKTGSSQGSPVMTGIQDMPLAEVSQQGIDAPATVSPTKSDRILKKRQHFATAVANASKNLQQVEKISGQTNLKAKAKAEAKLIGRISDALDRRNTKNGAVDATSMEADITALTAALKGQNTPLSQNINRMLSIKQESLYTKEVALDSKTLQVNSESLIKALQASNQKNDSTGDLKSKALLGSASTKQAYVNGGELDTFRSTDLTLIGSASYLQTTWDDDERLAVDPEEDAWT